MYNIIQMETGISNFDSAKREYFFNIGLEMRNALKMHKAEGLWDRVNGKRDFGNVSEHCLIEAARVDILAELLYLPEDIRKDLMTAATLHDFFKKKEKEIVIANGLSWESFEISNQMATEALKKGGFSERVIRLVNSVGHGSLIETERILNQDDLSFEDLAFLVMHYVDDYTTGSDWVPQFDFNTCKSALDMRMDKNEANTRYHQLNEDGKSYFNGETTFQAQRRIGNLVEQKLSVILSVLIHYPVASMLLSQIVDRNIRVKIDHRAI
jgi:hypothetical protein